MDHYEISCVLKEMALFLEFLDESPFRALAYRRAARTLAEIDNLEVLLEKNALETLPGIGKEIARMVKILWQHGYHSYHEELKKKIPEELIDLLDIPGLGIQIVKFLFYEMGIRNINDLEKACQAGDISQLRGYGPKNLQRLLKKIAELKKKGKYLFWNEAFKIAYSLQKRVMPFSQRVEIGGALRRKCELISEVSLVVTATFQEKVREAFLSHSFIKTIIKHTSHSIEVILNQNIKGNLVFVKPDHFPLSLLINTGSTSHVRSLKKETEWSLFKVHKPKNEQEIYQSLHMSFIPPELREGRGEIEAAKEKKLPRLIKKEDLRGAFHCHTTDSDGRNSLEEMVEQARKLGWEYIGISDHSKSSTQAKGMHEEKLSLQIERIQKLNKYYSDIHIFSGIECDILKEGNLDFSNEILCRLDFVIISIHRFFSMKKKAMTRRLIKAIENPYSTIVGHVSGRLLRTRDPYPIDIEMIIDACIANGKVMELNASPYRLDMDWRFWIKAYEKGLKCALNPDAHALHELRNCEWGVSIARKGWLEKKDIINTFPLPKLKKFLRR